MKFRVRKGGNGNKEFISMGLSTSSPCFPHPGMTTWLAPFGHPESFSSNGILNFPLQIPLQLSFHGLVLNDFVPFFFFFF